MTYRQPSASRFTRASTPSCARFRRARATYGQVAEIVGPSAQRMVAMPWPPARMTCRGSVSSTRRGKVSPRRPLGAEVQRLRLQEEGIAFDESYRMDLKAVRWAGPDREWLIENDFSLPEDRGVPPDEMQPRLF